MLEWMADHPISVFLLTVLLTTVVLDVKEHLSRGRERR